jgi:hypothetical protein
MPQMLRFECLWGHTWEVEPASLGPAADSDACPVCGAMGTSVRTANRHWPYARVWLYQQWNPGDETNDQEV